MAVDTPTLLTTVTSRDILVSTAIVVASGIAAKVISAILVRMRTSLSHVSKPIYILAFSISIFAGLRRLGVRENMAKLLDSAAYVAIVLASAYLVITIFKVLLLWYSSNVAARTQTRIDDEFLPLFQRLISIGIYTIALVMILAHFGQNISAIIAALGVSSLAIALASKEIIENTLAGFILLIDRPFTIGDRIKLPSGEMGIVKYIGLRNTKIRMETDDRQLLIVPNLEIMRTRIQNFTEEKFQ